MAATFSFPQWHPAVSRPSATMDDDGSDSDEYSENEESRLSLATSLKHIPNWTIKYFNYNTISGIGAVRKLSANHIRTDRRDGISKSFELEQSQFRPTYTEVKRVMLIAVPKPATSEPLGFIRFKHDKDGYCVGGLKLVNFNAILAYRTLGTGATTKARDAGQTGQHGEGMKLSELVFRSSKLTISALRAVGSSGSDKILKKMVQKASTQPRTPVAHPKKDFFLVIGAPGAARTIEDDKWRKVPLDIIPPATIVHVSQGGLIRDLIYKARMYLLGLRLPSGGTRGKDYIYGYNFNDGSTTRDRNSLARSGEEITRIAAIWAAAIRVDDSQDSDVTAEYTSLLLKSLNKKGDALLGSDDNCLPEEVAKKI
ncbi:hypothetical protein EJ02DRAFT_510403 [Clathrospora elynae]|uniref:Uncharacterized protein n=1 Tax=Clathrospora elynae TaxID=706981 RepID=A0A6A5SX38_9PLEO|nr:hypothetical protein EJ02DRAFT_510403 [Clathrospora elynae]